MRFDYASIPLQDDVPFIEGSIDELIAKQEKITEEKKKEASYIPLEKKDNSYFSISYQGKQKLSSYRSIPSYGEQLALQREDCSHNIPLKFVNIEAQATMGGVLGYVYPGDNKITLRDDLAGSGSSLSKEVDIHECVHLTPGDELGEYLTRLMSRWMMEKPKIKYKK